MARELVIIGAGGNAHDILDIVEAINAGGLTWNVRGLLDDNLSAGSRQVGLEVVGRICDANRFADAWFVNAIGSDLSYRDRPAIVAATGVGAERFATLVHPGACVSSRARVGRGTCVNHAAIVGGGAVIGDHVFVGPGCVVGHNSVIEDHGMMAAASVISGFVHLGKRCYVGASAVIRQRLQIGEAALIGMGAVVIRDVRDGCTVVGNPAVVLERDRVGNARKG